jgi:hypothetical protein
VSDKKDRVIVLIKGEKNAYKGNEVAAAVSVYRDAVGRGKVAKLTVCGMTLLTHGSWPKVFLA